MKLTSNECSRFFPSGTEPKNDGRKRFFPPSVINGILCLSVLSLVAFVYLPIRTFDFCGFDDDVYISENPIVRQGLSERGAVWALSTFRAANWHPLTWYSHMLDVSLFGTNPGGHHIINAAIHAANALLLFLFLAGMTQARWKSAIVAAIFAVHPLHVESVAWLAQRKDVLSAFFFLLLLGSYLRYVRSPSRMRLGVVTTLFFLGLSAKPMLVTTPFLLLLLDYWPLGRLGERGPDPGKLPEPRVPVVGMVQAVREKIPLFLLSALSAAVTWIAQSRGGATVPVHALPLRARIHNALVSYVVYLEKTVWPSNLSVFYPHPGESLTTWKILGAALLLGVVTGFVLRVARRRPYLAVGWLWFAGMLIPVIGLVQVGGQAMADRYMYLPLVGLSVAVVWGVSEILVTETRWGSVAAATATVLALGGLTWGGRMQVGYWKDGITLFSRAIRVTRQNALAHLNLGTTFMRRGRSEEAFRHFKEAELIDPSAAIVQNNLGAWYDQKGEEEAAYRYFREALRLWPEYALAHRNLAEVLQKTGNLPDATSHFREAARLDPENPAAQRDLARVLEEQGMQEEALARYREAVHLAPNDASFRVDLGITLAKTGDPEEAVRNYRGALRIEPSSHPAHYNLAVALERIGSGSEAIYHYERAIEIRPDDSKSRVNLGLALAREGRFEKAIRQYEEALRLHPENVKCLINFGVALAQTRRFREAEDRFREALRIDPDEPSALFNLGRVLEETGRRVEARRFYEKAGRSGIEQRPVRSRGEETP